MNAELSAPQEADRARAHQAIRAFFFINFFMNGTFMPFLGLYLMTTLPSSAEVGIILAISPIVKLVFQPIWAMLSGKQEKQVQYLFISLVGLAIASLGYLVSKNFTTLLLTTIIFSIFDAPYMPLGTSIAINYLTRAGEQQIFGKFRLWGTIGFIVSSTLIGPLLIGKYDYLFPVVYSISALISAFFALRLPAYKNLAEQTTEASHGSSPFLNQRFVLFLAGVGMVGFSMGILFQYFAIYLNEIQASSLIIGLSASVAALSEIPLMARSSNLISKFGLEKIFLVGIIATGLRFLLLYLFDDPILMLSAQLLHGFLIVSMLIIAPMYITKILPGPQQTLGQGLYSAAYGGIGTSIGLFVGGLVYSGSGIKPLWLMGLGVIMMGLFLLNIALKRKQSPAYQAAD